MRSKTGAGVLLDIGSIRSRGLELVITVLTIGHPTAQNTFKDLVPQLPRTLSGTAVFNCQEGLVMSLPTTDAAVALGGIQHVIVPLKLIRAVTGKQSLVLLWSTWLGH